MARSGENFRGKWRKQIKNTCTSVTGIVDEVYTDIATHNKWGLSLARTRDCGKRHWQIIFILTVLTRLSHAGTTLALQKYSFDITGNKVTHGKKKNVIIRCKTEINRNNVTGPSWKYFLVFPNTVYRFLLLCM